MFCDPNFYFPVTLSAPSIIVNSVQLYLFWSVFYQTLYVTEIYAPFFFFSLRKSFRIVEIL